MIRPALLMKKIARSLLTRPVRQPAAAPRTRLGCEAFESRLVPTATSATITGITSAADGDGATDSHVLISATTSKTVTVDFTLTATADDSGTVQAFLRNGDTTASTSGAVAYSAAIPVTITAGAGSGNVSFTVPANTPDGDYNVVIDFSQDATDATGFVTGGVTTDSTVAAPTVSLTNDTGNGTAGSSTDKVTSDASLTVTGTESGATVQYSTNGTTFSGVAPTFATDGSADGSHTVYVRQIDQAGNTSIAGTLTFTLDTTVPGAPTVALTNDTGSSNSDNITSDPSLTPSGETNATFEYSTDDATWFPDQASIAAYFTTDGAKTVYVRQIDVAGNVGAVHTQFDFTLDTTAPAAPGVSLNDDTGSSSADNYTSDPDLLITGLESGATVEYNVNTAGWSTVYAPVEGANSVQVRQTDVAGNVGSATTFAFTLDTVVSAPGLALTNDTGVSNSDNYTSDASVTTTAESGATVYYYVYDFTTSSYTEYDGTTYTAPTADGSYVVFAQQVDQAGNVSDYTNLFFTLDTTAPAAPTVSMNPDTTPSGAQYSADGDIAVINTEDAATYYQVDGGGYSTTYTPPTSLGAHQVDVYQQDQAGNTGPVSSITFTVVPQVSVIGGNLWVFGTDGSDTIRLSGRGSSVTVTGTGGFDGTYTGVTGRVIAYLDSGNDTLNASSLRGITLEAHGGDGGDNIKGGTGLNVLFGDAGDDVLTGGKSADVLVGGLGSDKLVGKAGNDVLVSGDIAPTNFVADFGYLQNVSSNWSAFGSEDGNVPFNTTPDFSGQDKLTGGGGHDWFILRLSDTSDVHFRQGDDFWNI